jgi:X-Pro dipeptidyl-peptidase
VTALVTVAGLVGPSAAFAAPAGDRPFVHGTGTVPVYSYANAIRESVWVRTSLDNDHDGVPDKVAVDLVRPREAAQAHVKVPVVMEASPYYSCCGRGNEGEIKGYDANGTINSEPLYYDNYFVPRGYAFVAVDLAGTNRSTGCEDVGGPEEVQATKQVIQWLNGHGTAFYADGSPARADWSTGKVGMIGKSWDGSIANGVAATGVDGLATVVPISAISSWYDYQRFNGVLRAEGYPEFLHDVVNGRPDAACTAAVDSLNNDSAESTGDFNAFWAQRDFRPDASKVKASVFIVHGINDQNVTTSQFGLWWQDLAAHGVPRKIWLAQESHVDPFDYRRGAWVDTLHRWFDHYLQGLNNGIDREPQASVESAPGVWTNQSTWPAAGAQPLRVPLGNGAGEGHPGTLNGSPGATGPGATRSYTDNQNLTEADSVAAPGAEVAGREVFLSAPLAHTLRLSGIPSVTLRVQVDQPTTELTAKLVDYGTEARVNYLGGGEGITTLDTQSCWGESTATDDACYHDTAEDVVTADHAVVTRGWQDAAHYRSPRFQTPLSPGKWYTITVPVQATDAVLPAGHVLGLVLVQSDQDNTALDDPAGNATVKLSIAGSYLTLPTTAHGLPFAGALPPTVTTADAPHADAERATTAPRKIPGA